MNLSTELTKQLNAHLDEVRKHLGTLPADERQEILQSIESHIYDALENRSDGEPTPALLDAVIAEMDPPESYGELPSLPKKKGRWLLILIPFVILALHFINNLPASSKAESDPIEQWSPNEEIIEGVGLPNFRIGDSKEQLVEALGAPDDASTDTWLQWKNHHVHALIDEHIGALELRFDIGFSGRTSEGIKTGSSEKEILAAYGTPENTKTKNGAKRLEWSSQGILVWLRPVKGVHQIVVFRPYHHFSGKTVPKNPIVPGVGYGTFRVGASRDELISALGKPDNDSEENLLKWSKLYIRCLLDDERKAYELQFDLGFAGQTEQGIKIGSRCSRLGQALGTYGEPTRSEKLPIGYKLIWADQGIWMQTGRGFEICQIGIFKKRPLESIQQAGELIRRKFELGSNTLKEGDALIIKQILSSSPDFKPGDAITVKGRFKLSSQPTATLLLTTTATQGDGRSNTTKEQRITVSKGSGEFDLTYTTPHHGCSHLAFYDTATGQSLGGLHFGTEEQIEEMEALKEKKRSPQKAKPFLRSVKRPSSPKPPLGKYAFQIMKIAAPAEIVQSPRVDVEKIIQHPDVKISEYPALVASLGESITNGQTEAISMDIDWGVVDGKPVTKEKIFRLGDSISITANKIENGVISYHLNMHHLELAGYFEHKTTNGFLEKTQPRFKKEAIDTDLTQKLDSWLMISGIIEQRLNGEKINQLTCIRVISSDEKPSSPTRRKPTSEKPKEPSKNINPASLPSKADMEKISTMQKANARERMREDREIYSQDERIEIETLYQVANKKWRSEEGKDSLKELISKYSSANRTGCALLYLGQQSTGDEQIEYLRRAINDFSDCFYGDGVQVGPYARFVLFHRYKKDGENEKVAKLADEIKTLYPDSISHRKQSLVALVTASALAENSSGIYSLSFENEPIRIILAHYCKIIGRTLLMATDIPDKKMTLRAKSLTKNELISAIEEAMKLRDIDINLLGDKYVKVTLRK